MKLIALFASIVCLSSYAFALSPYAAPTTVLHYVELNGAEDLKRVAIATVDSAHQTLTITIQNDVCGIYQPVVPGVAKCHLVVAPDTVLSVPLKVQKDACGSTTYTGVKDSRPVDGARVEITLVDNTTRTCTDAVLGREVLNVQVDSPRGNSTSYLAYDKPAAQLPVASPDQAIYDALNVPEVYLNPGVVGVSRTQKSVGGLTCVRSVVVYPNAVPTYSCELVH